jgi:hypothetical protein
MYIIMLYTHTHSLIHSLSLSLSLTHTHTHTRTHKYTNTPKRTCPRPRRARKTSLWPRHADKLPWARRWRQQVQILPHGRPRDVKHGPGREDRTRRRRRRNLRNEQEQEAGFAIRPMWISRMCTTKLSEPVTTSRDRRIPTNWRPSSQDACNARGLTRA